MSDRIHAPELSGGIDWLNVPAPLALSDLRGKVVLVDFWTYGCINCMHVLPDLRRLEEKYRDANNAFVSFPLHVQLGNRAVL